MPEDKYISSGINVTINNNDIELYVYYNPTQIIPVNFFVPDEDILIQGVPFQADHLGYSYEGLTDPFEINIDGDLIVDSDTPDSYNINDDGNLIYSI